MAKQIFLKFLLGIMVVLHAVLSFSQIQNRENIDAVARVSFFKIMPEKGFSVSSDMKVLFSPGNLQYNKRLMAWRFAPTSYTYCGMDNYDIVTNEGAWIDLFGWATSGKDSSYASIYSAEDILYGPCSNLNEGEEWGSTWWDWGKVNIISDPTLNIEYDDGTWFTLSMDQFNYLLFDRSNASSLYGFGNVDGIEGLIILPDEWQLPEGINFTSAGQKNIYTSSQWGVMNHAGAVFLPSAGQRDGDLISQLGVVGKYWTTNKNKSLEIDSRNKTVQIKNVACHIGLSVRLVRPFRQEK